MTPDEWEEDKGGRENDPDLFRAAHLGVDPDHPELARLWRERMAEYRARGVALGLIDDDEDGDTS